MAIGSSINAGLNRPDYSGIMQGAQASANSRMQGAQATAQGYAALGQGIGQGIQQYQQKQSDKKKKEEAFTGVNNLLKANHDQAIAKGQQSLAKRLNIGMDESGVFDKGAMQAAIAGAGGAENFYNFAMEDQQRIENDQAQVVETNAQSVAAGLPMANVPVELGQKIAVRARQLLEERAYRTAQTGSMNRSNPLTAADPARGEAELAKIRAETAKLTAETSGLTKSLTEDKKAAEFGWEWSEDGSTLQVVKGGPQDIKNRDASSQAALDSQMRRYSLDESLANIDNVAIELNKALGEASVDAQGNSTGERKGGLINASGSTGFGSWVKWLPLSNAKELDAVLTTIKANIGFDRLQRMRELSKTGGALGQVAVEELKALQASIASLDQGMGEEALRINLMQVLSKYNSIRENFAAQRNALETKQPNYSASDALTGYSGK